jgi:hypothetical protein
MLFFRSEEDLNGWLQIKNAKRGAVLSIEKMWELSQHWYHNRLSLDYHGRSMEQVQAIFADVGLTSEFWLAG